jgi:glycosyltransferase 2 family protein
MKNKVVTIVQYAAFLGLGLFLVWWSIHKMDEKNWADCKDALSNARYILIIPVFFILSASHISRAIRWKILMKPMGYQPSLLNTFCAVMVGYLANLAIPRLGEVLKCTILAKYEKVPADKLVGTILIERAVDVVSLLVIFIIALVTQASIIGQFAKDTIRENFLSGSRQSLITKYSILAGVIVLVFFLSKIIFKKYQNNPLIEKIKKLFDGIKTGLGSIAQLQDKKAFIFHSIFIWSCYIVATYIGFSATQGTSILPFVSVFPVLAFGSIAMIITPGGIGTYPTFLMKVMVLYNIEEGIGYANGTLQWVAQFVIILIVGFIAMLLLPYYNKKKKPDTTLSYEELTMDA